MAADANYAGPADEIKVSHRVHRTLRRYTIPVDDGQGTRLGRLAGGVAHDFNNMLSVITINAEVAIRRGTGDDYINSHLNDINLAAQRATALTRQFLIFSRKQTLEPKELGLNELILDLHKMLRQLIGEHIKFVVPTFDEASMVKVDPSQYGAGVNQPGGKCQ